MDSRSRQNIAEIEKQLGHATGIGLIERGECPRGALTPVACTFCECGHMLDCHYPKTCEEAECSHYRREVESESYYSDEE